MVNKMINILLVDDHQIVRTGIRNSIEDEHDIDIIGEAADGKEAIDLCRKESPDLVLMDVNMPVMNGIEATKKITSDMPEISIIGLSMHHGNQITEEMQSAGASAFLTKTDFLESLVVIIRKEASV